MTAEEILYTLTHEPLALAVALTIGIALFASGVVGIAAYVLYTKPRTAAARSADAAGPGVARLGAPGPDPKADGDLLQRDFRAWQDAGKPGMWPVAVVPGRNEP